MRTKGWKCSAPASHLGSGSRSMRRLATMGLMDRSDGCQISFSSAGWPAAARPAGGTGAAAEQVLHSYLLDYYLPEAFHYSARFSMCRLEV